MFLYRLYKEMFLLNLPISSGIAPTLKGLVPPM